MDIETSSTSGSTSSDIPLDQQWTVNPACQPDEYLTCPYFPEHKFRKKRLIYHLMKCESNPAAPKLLICPFNYTHRVSYQDRKAHLVTCPDNPKKSRIFDERAPSFKNTVKSFGPDYKPPKEWASSELPENEREWFP